MSNMTVYFRISTLKGARLILSPIYKKNNANCIKILFFIIIRRLEYCICDTHYTEPDSIADGEELRLNMLGEGFAWIGGSYKPVKRDQCAGYS